MNAALGVMPPQAAVVVVAKDTDPSARAGLAEEVVTSPSMLKGTSESWASHLLLFSFITVSSSILKIHTHHMADTSTSSKSFSKNHVFKAFPIISTPPCTSDSKLSTMTGS